MRDFGPSIPAQPFVEWLNQQIHAIEVDQRRAYRLANGTDAPTGPSPYVTPYLTLAARLGVAERTVWRYAAGLKSVNVDGRSVEVPTDTFSLHPVEDLLDRAGVRVYDLYPELDDHPLQPDTYCRVCRDWCSPIHGVCPWCDTPVNVGEGRPKRSASRLGQGRLLTDEQLAAAYRRHTDDGVSLRQLGRELYRDHGYASANSCTTAIVESFKRLGWPTRDRISSMRLTYLGDENAVGLRDPSRRREYLQQRRQKRAAGHSQCSATVDHTGERCTKLCSPGKTVCTYHTPEFVEQASRHLERARAAQTAAAVPADVLEEARRLREQGHGPYTIGRRLVDRTPWTSRQYAARAIAAALDQEQMAA